MIHGGHAGAGHATAGHGVDGADRAGAGHGGHGLGGAGHAAARGSSAGVRWLVASMAVLVAFMVGELIAGLHGHSLALITDSAHLLTDVVALAVALAATRISMRPARGAFTYGFARVDALGGQASGITLLLLAGWFAALAIRHLANPPPTAGGLVTVVALVGVLVNLIATALASRADRTRLSIRGAFVHLVNDLWAFLATAVAGLIILTTGWTRADALASLVVAVLMGITGVGLLRASSRQLLEAAPQGVDPFALGAELAAVAGVAQVHDLHVWELGHLDSAVSAHVLVRPGYDCHAVGAQLRELLDTRYGLHHATLQLDHDQATVGVASADTHCDDAHGPVHSGRA